LVKINNPLSANRLMAGEGLEELLRRRYENLPPQLTPLASPWLNEVLPALISLGKKLDELTRRVERVERLLEEIKNTLMTKT